MKSIGWGNEGKEKAGTPSKNPGYGLAKNTATGPVGLYCWWS